MARKAMIERERKRRRMVAKYADIRTELKETIYNRELPMEQRFSASMKLAKLPRNSSSTRLRNRCELTGRPRGYYRKLRISRIAVRELGGSGQIPGMVKSSW
ncbi:MAG: 30S ribosomal protein S14 [Rhodobacteraceae bacterium]|nr:30S ribosomal protein S14 [Paracoccaceae bacterium]